MKVGFTDQAFNRLIDYSFCVQGSEHNASNHYDQNGGLGL